MARQRHRYQAKTRRGWRRKASGVASSWGSNRAQRPELSSRNVGTPDSWDMPEPVKTTSRRASRSSSAARTDSGDMAVSKALRAGGER